MSALPAEAAVRWTSADLELLPDNGARYEIVEGELFVSKQPHWHHQKTSGRIFAALDSWAVEAGHGDTSHDPGVIFDDENDVAPDVAWVSSERLLVVLGEDGKLHGAPDLAVEVLSPGSTNVQRDKKAKLKLYSQRGVREYWVADWRAKTIEIYRREVAELKLAATLYAGDELTSPLLPGFKVSVARLFPG
ncbi:MAG: Uma2 family endonuclease [Chloroflexi bacterium]|nr:Uma2 family endonuclease [Chloroflexota bacterium]